MGLFNDIKAWFVVEDNKPQPQNQLRANTPGADLDKRGVIHKLRSYFEPRVEVAMKIWKRAVAQAEDALRPRREELYRLYHRALEDDHLLSQVRTARFTVQMSDFRVSLKGKEAEDLKKLFEKPWFQNYLQHCVDSELYGHSLVEFDSRMEDGEFQQVLLVPRIHVRPEYGEVVLYSHDERGIPFREKPLVKHLVEIGESNDLGLLKVLSKVVIRKEYSLTDWSRRNEKYGMPFLTVKTATRDKKELNAKAEMAANFGSNGWAVLDEQDEIDMLESNQAFAFQSFSTYADWADKAISKLVNGQTGTTEEQAYVGSAEVHERMLNTYTKARMRRIQYHINFKLIPFLIENGYPLGDAQFEFLDLLPKSTDDKPDNMDNDGQPTPPKQTPHPQQKKKKKLTVSERLSMHLIYKDAVPCCEDPDHTHTLAMNAGGIDVQSIAERGARKVFDRKVAAGELDADTWEYFSSQILAGFQDGLGRDLYSTSYRKPSDWETTWQLRNNIFVFSAFKNHKQIEDMVNLLQDDQGNVREWPAFKTEAEKLNADYFENWLRAEYNTAIATGQTTAKWEQFKENADVLPYLSYVTQNDARVRDAHRALEGVTKRLDDPFWDEYYPPNGWNCRCDIIQTAGPASDGSGLEPSEEQVPPLFRNNPAKSGELFPQSHPYYQGLQRGQRERLLKAISRLVYDNYDDKWQRLNYAPDTGGYVVKHAMREDDGFEINTARMLATEGRQVELLQPIGESPDASIDGKLTAIGHAADIDDAVTEANEGWRRAQRLLIRMTKTVDKAEMETRMRAWLAGRKGEVEIRFIDNDKIIIK